MSAWPEDRRSELAELLTLLREASMIDSGSGALARIRRCEEIADRLMRDDAVTPRKSFAAWLADQATAP